MNARERLLDALNGNSTPMEPYESLIDAYAHELAEKIRNSKRLRDYTDDHMSDCNEAADEIDPEVLNSGS